MENNSDFSHFKLSKYAIKLAESEKKRYLEKISVVGGVDPYLLSETDAGITKQKNLWPKISFTDIFNYLINSKSAYTNKKQNAVKSLEAYKFVEAGYVKTILVKTFDTNRLLIGSVKHSMRNELTRCWLIVAATGRIFSAHCDCVAGIGEVCSHVAAVLFAINKEQESECEVSNGFLCCSLILLEHLISLS
jgi:hypothetical protein